MLVHGGVSYYDGLIVSLAPLSNPVIRIVHYIKVINKSSVMYTQ